MFNLNIKLKNKKFPYFLFLYSNKNWIDINFFSKFLFKSPGSLGDFGQLIRGRGGVVQGIGTDVNITSTENLFKNQFFAQLSLIIFIYLLAATPV